MQRFNINKFHIFLLSAILLSVAYLYFIISDINKQITQNVEKMFLVRADNVASNLIVDIQKAVPDGKLYTTLKNDPALRQKLEHLMSVSVTPTFKYIYLLYRDKSGHYRYLLDGSKEDKGEFDNRFEINEAQWNEVYTTLSPKVLIQQNIDQLYVTYLKPLIYKGKVEAILAIDFSTRLIQQSNELLKPVTNVFFSIFALVVILLLALLYQAIVNLRTKKESITDELTGTYNRTYLRDFLNFADPQKYQLAIMDVDFFKKINDNYGHKAGDYILQEVAAILKKMAREKDIIIRFGGEEFLLFFKKEKNEKVLPVCIAERIREYIEKQHFHFDGNDIKLTISAGVVLQPHRYKNIHDAIKKADELLYMAKKNGRNQVIVDDETIADSEQNNQQLTLSEIKEALDEDRLICHYQPIFSLETEEIVKYESLVRIEKKDHTLLYPNSFLDTIANTNIYNEMTKKVLEAAFEKIELYKISISVNMNLSDILNTTTYKLIKAELEENKELANYLTVELLEYEETNEELLRERLIEIKSYGVTIALDDFGSGYSNFSVFQTLPIDILKIDGSIIKDIENSEISFAITQAIVLFCKKLNIETVAEFVHSQEVLQKVKESGIDKAQGFYLGKPTAYINSH